MKVILDYFYDDLEQRCLNPECDFRNGPYSEVMRGPCPRCWKSGLGFFRAFGTAKERSVQVQEYEGRVR